MERIECRAVKEHLETFVYGGLDEQTAAQLRAHMEACPDCRSEYNALTIFLGKVDESVDRAEIDERSAERIWSNLSTSIARTKRQKTISAIAAAAIVLIAAGVYLLSVIEKPPVERKETNPPPTISRVPQPYEEYRRKMSARTKDVLRAHLSADAEEIPAIMDKLQFTGPLLVDSLHEVAEDQDASIARLAVMLLGKSGSSRATPFLLEAVGRNDVRRQAISALGERTHAGASAALAKLLDDKDVRPAAMKSLARMNPAMALEHLLPYVATDRQAVLSALRQIEDRELSFLMYRVLAEGRLHREAVDVCISVERNRCIKTLTYVVESVSERSDILIDAIADATDTRQALSALIVLSGNSRLENKTLEAIKKMYQDNKKVIGDLLLSLGSIRSQRKRVIAIIAFIGNGYSVKMLSRVLQWDDTQKEVITALSETKSPEAVPVLAKCLQSPALQEEAVGALAQLTGEKFGADRELWMKWYSQNQRRSKE